MHVFSGEYLHQRTVVAKENLKEKILSRFTYPVSRCNDLFITKTTKVSSQQKDKFSLPIIFCNRSVIKIQYLISNVVSHLVS